ncbi:hypothetical protein ILYODFUR_027186 [Ilyodon furcidens]|uniref:Uncharacterized protein n=1 Tax=Ilyodon furcidens TaxID=33524 RepID=A0ABV0SS61_9TELE
MYSRRYKNPQAIIILGQYSTRPQGWEYGCGSRFSSENIRPGLASKPANVLLCDKIVRYSYSLPPNEAKRCRGAPESRTIPSCFCPSSSALLRCHFTVHSSTLVQPMSDHQVLHTGIARSPHRPIEIEPAQ